MACALMAVKSEPADIAAIIAKRITIFLLVMVISFYFKPFFGRLNCPRIVAFYWHSVNRRSDAQRNS